MVGGVIPFAANPLGEGRIMGETLVLIVIVMLAMFVMVLLSAFEDTEEPLEQTPVYCDRQRCRHTDCQYHPEHADGHVIRTDLMWSMICPHYRWTEDLDDQEG